jgi:hypothetical protein
VCVPIVGIHVGVRACDQWLLRCFVQALGLDRMLIWGFMLIVLVLSKGARADEQSVQRTAAARGAAAGAVS